jgi:hypothetical protein
MMNAAFCAMPLGMLLCAFVSFTYDFVYFKALKGSIFLIFFRLHKLLLQPRGVKPVASENTDKACPMKVKKVIGKIRVEGMVVNSLKLKLKMRFFF